MRIANGLELELRALKREIEARRDAQVESHERLGNILETGQLFHHDDGAETLDDDDRAEAEAERAHHDDDRAEAERAYQQSRRAPGD